MRKGSSRSRACSPRRRAFPREGNAYTRDEVAEKTGLDYWSAVSELDKLVSKGKVETTGGAADLLHLEDWIVLRAEPYAEQASG